MKRIVTVVAFALVLLLCQTVSAAETENNALDIEKIYGEYLENSGAEELKDSLPNEVSEMAEELVDFDYSFQISESFTPQNVFSVMLEFLKSGCKKPFVTMGAILAVMLFGATVGNLDGKNKTVSFVLTVSICSVAVVPIVTTVSACVSALKSAAAFMLAFVPVFAAVLVSRGKTVTSAGFSSVMIAVSEGVSALCGFIVMPLVGSSLGLSIGGSVLPEVNTASFGRAIKRISTWIMTLLTTVLLGVLSVQTVVGVSADSLKFKTAKFLVGSTVPIVGAAVGEALSAVNGCIKLLGSSVAAYGIVAVCIMFLPLVVELLLWRVVLLLSGSVAEILALPKVNELLSGIDSAVSFVLGIMILIGVLFVISVTLLAVV